MSMRVAIQYRWLYAQVPEEWLSPAVQAVEEVLLTVLVLTVLVLLLVLLCSCLHCRAVAHACALLCSRDFVVCRAAGCRAELRNSF